MFYDYGLNIAFIHIPRSAGCSISISVKPYMTLGGCWDLADRRHLSSSDMRSIIGSPDFERMIKFCVYRPFDEIVSSYISFIGKERLKLRNSYKENKLSFRWKSLLRLDVSDEELKDLIWDRNGWPNNETDWLNYWIGDIKDEVHILNFYNLEEDWELFCRHTIKIPDLILYRINCS